MKLKPIFNGNWQELPRSKEESISWDNVTYSVPEKDAYGTKRQSWPEKCNKWSIYLINVNVNKSCRIFDTVAAHFEGILRWLKLTTRSFYKKYCRLIFNHRPTRLKFTTMRWAAVNTNGRKLCLRPSFDDIFCHQCHDQSMYVRHFLAQAFIQLRFGCDSEGWGARGVSSPHWWRDLRGAVPPPIKCLIY